MALVSSCAIDSLSQLCCRLYKEWDDELDSFATYILGLAAIDEMPWKLARGHAPRKKLGSVPAQKQDCSIFDEEMAADLAHPRQVMIHYVRGNYCFARGHDEQLP